ncbi:MAG TPA: hypothetical protein VE733_28570 [Streptosporangiaceae bacterium]|jgi:hypothetical protein|nr:hypothetical protein [Streptosporangiaceae bacterium]
MDDAVEALERRIDQLRVAVREAVVAGDRDGARALRGELKSAERAWEDALVRMEGGAPAASEPAAGERPGRHEPAGPLIPLREQVHQALSLLTVPAAPRLIVTVHEAFFAASFPVARLTSLRRDEERSFRSAPFARPYYICAALTADLLAPARGLLAISTWPMEKRVIGPLSPRVHFLTAAIRVAESIERIPGSDPDVRRLLWRFAANIPGAAGSAAAMEPRAVAEAARAELEIHEAADLDVRRPAAQRARRQLDDAAQLFGSRLQVSQPGRRAARQRGTAS